MGEHMLDKDRIIERANAIYAQRKLGTSAFYQPPEVLPEIKSDQVHAIVEALCDELNRILNLAP